MKKIKIPLYIVIIYLCMITVAISVFMFTLDSVNQWQWIGFLICSFLLVLPVFYMLLRLSKHLTDGFHYLFCQLEAHQNILSIIKPRLPLPSLQGWAILPDSGSILLSYILQMKPKIIVECGSGLSTLLSCYAMRINGFGKIFSIEHNSEYAEATIKMLMDHGFSEEEYHVIVSPLKKQTNKTESYVWYDITYLDFLPEQIDILIVDGPPHKTQIDARYPAIPVLYQKLSPKAIVILDDAARADERRIVKRWLREYPHMTETFYPTHKGVSVIRKSE